MVHNLEKFKQAAALMAAMTPAGAVAEFVVTTERGGLSVSIAADGTISRTFYAKPFAEDHNAHEVPVDMSAKDIAAGMFQVYADDGTSPSAGDVEAALMHGVGVIKEWKR